VKDSSKIIEWDIYQDIHVVGLDAAQFFDGSIIPVIYALLETGKRIILNGLDFNFRGVSFGNMPLLMAIANQITKLQAIYTVCGGDAKLTQHLVNG
jgi:thymidine kinase